MFTHKDIALVENLALYFIPKVSFCLTSECLFYSDPRPAGMLIRQQPSLTNSGGSSPLFRGIDGNTGNYRQLRQRY